MIQRIQTIYLLLVALFRDFCLFGSTSGQMPMELKFMPVMKLWFRSCFLLVAVLALIAILLFKNRKNQFVLNRLNMILNLFLLGFFVYRSLNLSGETSVSEKGIGMLIPVFSIVFLVLANRAIKKDEDLVKSVDRLR